MFHLKCPFSPSRWFHDTIITNSLWAIKGRKSERRMMIWTGLLWGKSTAAVVSKPVWISTWKPWVSHNKPLGIWTNSGEVVKGGQKAQHDTRYFLSPCFFHFPMLTLCLFQLCNCLNFKWALKKTQIISIQLKKKKITKIIKTTLIAKKINK